MDDYGKQKMVPNYGELITVTYAALKTLGAKYQTNNNVSVAFTYDANKVLTETYAVGELIYSGSNLKIMTKYNFEGDPTSIVIENTGQTDSIEYKYDEDGYFTYLRYNGGEVNVTKEKERFYWEMTNEYSAPMLRSVNVVDGTVKYYNMYDIVSGYGAKELKVTAVAEYNYDAEGKLLQMIVNYSNGSVTTIDYNYAYVYCP